MTAKHLIPILSLIAHLHVYGQQNSLPPYIKVDGDYSYTGAEPGDAVFNRVWIDRDQTVGGRRGMLIHLDFDLHKHRYKKCVAVAWFFDHFENEYEYPLTDQNGDYCHDPGAISQQAPTSRRLLKVQTTATVKFSCLTGNYTGQSGVIP